MPDPVIDQAGKKRPARISLTNWLIISVVCLNLLLVFVGIKGLWSSHQNAVAQATLTVNNLANVLERNLSTSGTVIDFALQGITDSIEAMLRQGELQDDPLDALLANYGKRYSEVSGFRISRQDGTLWWGKGIDRTAPLNISNRDYFVQQRDKPGKFLTVTAPLLGKITNESILIFARSFHRPDGSFAGVVVAPIPIAYFNRVLADVFLGTKGIAAIRHDDLSLVTVFPPPTNPDVVVGTKKISSELRELLEKGVRRADYRTATAPDGVDRLYSYRNLEHFPLLVIAGVSPGDYMGNWYDEVRNTAILLFAVLVLSFFGTRLLIKFWRQKNSDYEVLQSQEMHLRDALIAVDQREQLLRSAIDTIGEAFVIYDQDDRLVACNDQFKAYYAHSAAVIEPGRTFEEIVRYGVKQGQYFDAIGREEAWIAERLKSHREASSEVLQKLGDGRWLSIRERRTPAGHLVGFRVDITSLVQAKVAAETLNLALAESEVKFRQMFDDAPDAYLIMELQSGCFRACNRAAERLLRASSDQILGKTPEQFSPVYQPDGRTSQASSLEKIGAAEKLGYQLFEWVYRRADGESFWGEVAVSPSVYGGVRVLFFVLRDISDRKRTELELHDYRSRLERRVEERTADLMVAKEAAEAASRAKTAFLSMASHELRTPMNGVMGTLALAMKQTVDPKLLDYLAKADRASKQLLAIINDVLDISRIESAKLMLSSERFNLGEIRLHLLDAVEPIANSKGLILSYPAEPQLELRSFLGDSLRLTQILINLVGNAVKFTKAGQISVLVREVTCDTSGAARLRFEVQDTGVGIPADDLSRIFEPFEQSGHSGHKEHRGTGLGLALCKRLVDAMHGSIGVSTEIGSGSLFWFEVEVETSEAGEHSTAHTATDPGDVIFARHHGARVLLVDDEPLNLEIAQALLEDVGLSIVTVEDGLYAVDCASAAEFDLILMDMNMPKMGGIDATREIRKIAGHAHTPIIAMTANAFIEDRIACIEAGMDDHLGKPVMPEVLYQTILVWLDKSKELKRSA